AAGNRYVVSTSFTSGSPHFTSMVTKFDPDGATVWTTRIGRRDSETNSFEETNSTGIVADAAGNTYAVGSTKKTPGDFTDAFVTTPLAMPMSSAPSMSSRTAARRAGSKHSSSSTTRRGSRVGSNRSDSERAPTPVSPAPPSP